MLAAVILLQGAILDVANLQQFQTIQSSCTQLAVGFDRLDEGSNFLCAVELRDVGICSAPLLIPRAVNKSDDSFHEALPTGAVRFAFKCSRLNAGRGYSA